jgi:DNA-binding transcriptional regulator LsrR (DeoR family)
MMAQFVDAAGQPIDHPINGRAIAPPLEALRKVPNVVFASGGDGD